MHKSKQELVCKLDVEYSQVSVDKSEEKEDKRTNTLFALVSLNPYISTELQIYAEASLSVLQIYNW